MLDHSDRVGRWRSVRARVQHIVKSIDSKIESNYQAYLFILSLALFASPCGGAKADIIVDDNNSAGQFQIVTAPGNYTQTINLIDDSGFAIEVDSTNGPNGILRIRSGAIVATDGNSALIVRSGTEVSHVDIQGVLLSTLQNAINTASNSTITTFTNSGTIQADSTGAAAAFFGGTVTDFANTGSIQHSTGSAGLVIDNATTLTNDTTGTISSAGFMAVRLGFSNPATIGSFTNRNLISGGTIGIELGRQAGSTAGITNSGTITGGVDGLVVLNGSELTAFDNTGGVIQSTGASGAGLHLSEDQDISITNAGTLRSTSTGNGLLLDTEGQTRDFTNSGTISSDFGTAIVAEAAMTGDTDGFVNSGTITGGGGIAIDARDAFRLTNSGGITGDISHTTAGVLTVKQTGGWIDGDITSTADAAHDLEFGGGTITGNIVLDGTTANTFALNGAIVLGDVDLGDGAAHTVSLSEGSISGALDIGSGTTALTIHAAAGDTVTIGSLATDSTTTTNIGGAGDVHITTFTVDGAVNQSAGTLSATALSIGPGGSFTQSGASVLNVPVVNLNGAATLNLNGTTARVTGAISGTVDSQVFVNGTFTSEGTIDVGHFEIADGGVFNMAHDVTVTSPTTFANLGTLVIEAGDTVTVTGNYTQGADGVLQTNVANDTAFGKLVVTGTATLPSNARIHVNVADADFGFTAAEMRNVVSAGTLVSDGTFVVTDNSSLFDFQAVVSGSAVDLCLAAAGRSCGDGSSTGVLDAVVANGNEPGVGAAVVFDDLIDAFVADGTSGNSGMDDVIGLLGALGTQRDVSDAVSQTLPLLAGSAAIPVKDALSGTRRIVRSRLSDNGGRPMRDLTLADKHIWVTGFGTRHDYDGRRGVTGYDGSSAGLVIGADGNIGARTELGVAFAHSSTDIDSDTKLNSADIDTYQLIGYGRYALSGTTEASFQIGLGWSETDGKRTIAFVGGAPVARSSYDSASVHLGGGIGRTIEIDGATQFVPSMRVDYTRLESDGYTETGAGALNIDAASDRLTALELGVGGELRFRINDKVGLIASVDLAYDTLNERAAITGKFAGGGGGFVTRGIDPGPWIGHAGLGLPITLDNGARIAVRYDLEARDDTGNHTASVTFRRRF